MIARVQKSMNEKDKGFTLIELLVVIIIIGILSAIAIPVFLNQRKKAVDASIKSDLRTVAEEVETYYTDHQEYPATVADSTNPTTGPNKIDVNGATEDGDITLSKGNVVTYKLDGTGESYVLTGTNEKATANGTDGHFEYNSAEGGLNPEMVKTTTPAP